MLAVCRTNDKVMPRLCQLINQMVPKWGRMRHDLGPFSALCSDYAEISSVGCLFQINWGYAQNRSLHTNGHVIRYRASSSIFVQSISCWAWWDTVDFHLEMEDSVSSGLAPMAVESVDELPNEEWSERGIKVLSCLGKRRCWWNGTVSTFTRYFGLLYVEISFSFLYVSPVDVQGTLLFKTLMLLELRRAPLPRVYRHQA